MKEMIVWIHVDDYVVAIALENCDARAMWPKHLGLAAIPESLDSRLGAVIGDMLA